MPTPNLAKMGLILFVVLHMMIGQLSRGSVHAACPPKTYGRYCDGCYCNWTNAIACNSYDGTCHCSEGFAGPFCEDDVNECFEDLSSCPDRACKNQIGSFECICPRGFFSSPGGRCSPCYSNTYGNNCEGTCHCIESNTITCDSAVGECVCKDGWEGFSCESSVDDCIGHNCPGGTCEDQHLGFECICGENKMHINGACEEYHVIMVSFNSTLLIGEFVDIYILYNLPNIFFKALPLAPNIRFKVSDDKSDDACWTDFKQQSRPIESTTPLLAKISKTSENFEFYTIITRRFMTAGFITVTAKSELLRETLYLGFDVRFKSRRAENCLKDIEIPETQPRQFWAADRHSYDRQAFLQFEVKMSESQSCFEFPRVTWKYYRILEEQSLSLCLDPNNVEELDVDSLIARTGQAITSDHQQMKETIPGRTFPAGIIMICVTAYIQRSMSTRVVVCGFIKVLPSWSIVGQIQPSVRYIQWKPSSPFTIGAKFEVIDDDKVELRYLWTCVDPVDKCAKFRFRNDQKLLILFSWYMEAGFNYTFVLRVSVIGPPTQSTERKITIINYSDEEKVLPTKLFCVRGCTAILTDEDEISLRAEAYHPVGIPKISWKVIAKPVDGSLPPLLYESYNISQIRAEHKYDFMFKSRKGVLKAGYDYTITALSTDMSDNRGSPSYSFKVEAYPSGDGCTISPNSGKAVFSRFTIECFNYTDKTYGLPLSYRLYQQFEESEGGERDYSWELVAYSNRGLMSNITFSSHENAATIPLRIEISTVKQTTLVVNSSIQIETDDQDVILRNAENNVKSLSKAGNQEDLRLIKDVATVMEKTGTASHEKKVQVREELLQSMKDFESVGADIIEHSSLVLSEVVGRVDEVPIEGLGDGLDTAERITKYLGKTGRGNFDATKSIAGLQVSAMNDLLKVSAGFGNLITDNTEAPDTKESFISIGKENARKILQSILQITKILRGSFDTSKDPVKMKRDSLEILLEPLNVKTDKQISLAPDDERVSFNLKSDQLEITGDGDVEAEFKIFDKTPFSWAIEKVHGDLPVVKVDFVEPSIEKAKHKTKDTAPKTVRFSTPADIFIENKNLSASAIEYPLLIFVDSLSKEVYMSSCVFLTILASTEEATLLRISSDDGLTVQAKAKYTNADSTFERLTDYDMIEFPFNTNDEPFEFKIGKRNLTRQDDFLFLPRLTKHQINKNIPFYKVKLKLKAQQKLSNQFDFDQNIASTLIDELIAKSNLTIKKEYLKIFNISISVIPYKLSCIHYDDERQEFQTDSCQLSPFTHIEVLHCRCVVAASFSASLLVVPRFVEPWDVELFLRVFENPLAVSAVIALWMTFLALFLWGRRKDRQDDLKRGATILSDNKDSYAYVYLVCVTTGSSISASTTSNVYMYIRGSWYKSDVHHLSDESRALYRAGAENWFVLTTECDLGYIKSIIIWTDYSGGHPSWFLYSVFIQNLHTGECWMCLYNSWLSATKGSGQVLTEIPAVEERLNSRRDWMSILTYKGRNDIRNDHLWIGMVYKTAYNRFTRVRRLATGLTILHALMVLNLMFFEIIDVDDSRQFMHLFGYNLHVTSILITILTTTISSLLGFSIVFIFSRIPPREVNKAKDNEESIEKNEDSNKNAALEDQDISTKDMESFARFLGKDVKDFTDEEKQLFEILYEQYKEKEKKEQEKIQPVRFLLPRWFLYVFWTFLFVLNLFTAYFVMLYGLELGYNKSVEWLFTFFAGFLLNVFVMQPLKVGIMVLLLVLVFRQTHSLKEQAPFSNIREGFRAIKDQQNQRKQQLNRESNKYQPPPSNSRMKTVWRRLQIEMEAREMLRNVLLYAMFLIALLLVISWHCDVRACYMQTKAFDRLLLTSVFEQEDDGDLGNINKIKTVEDIWTYMTDDLVPFLERTQDEALHIDNLFSVGSVRIRQVRVKRDHGSCGDFSSDFMSLYRRFLCAYSYSDEVEETQNFNASWQNVIYHERVDPESPYTYKTGQNLQTASITGNLATYPGGGYTTIIQLVDRASAIMSIRKIANSSWVDHFTRCIFIEFTIYNANANLFTNFVLGFEFDNYGGPFPFKSIMTSRLFHYDGTSKSYVQSVEILVMVFTAFYTFITLNKARQQGILNFIFSFWNWVDITILFLILLAAVFAYLRFTTLASVLEVFAKYGNNRFLDFQDVFYKDQLFLVTEGILSGFAIIKLIHIFRFNPFTTTCVKTFEVARGDVLGYTIMVALYILAFGICGLFLFGRLMYSYVSLGRCLLTLLFFLMGEPNYEELQETNRIMGPLFFLAVLCITQYIIINFFVSMIRDGLDIARCLEYGKENAVLNYMANTLKMYLGQKSNKVKVYQN